MAAALDDSFPFDIARDLAGCVQLHEPKFVSALFLEHALRTSVKADGSRRPKVFKMRRVAIGPGEAERLSLSFCPMTTRVHYPGRHEVEALFNGVAHPLGSFVVSGRAGKSMRAAESVREDLPERHGVRRS